MVKTSLGILLALGLSLGTTAMAAHCNLGGNNRIIEDPQAPHARAVCLAEGKVLCQLDGAFDTWCQEQKAGSVSVACLAKEGPLSCCTGWAGSGLPPQDAKCRPAK